MATQAQKDRADVQIKNTLGFPAFDAARTNWEAESDPAAKYALCVIKNRLVAVCVDQAGIP